MAKIINQDASILGELTVNPTNATGDVLTLDGSNVVKKRTPAQTLGDIGAAAVGHVHNYVHDQTIASATWNVNHALGKFCSVMVVDSARTVVIGQIDYVDINNVTITFNGAFSGYAYFN